MNPWQLLGRTRPRGRPRHWMEELEVLNQRRQWAFRRVQRTSSIEDLWEHEQATKELINVVRSERRRVAREDSIQVREGPLCVKVQAVGKDRRGRINLKELGSRNGKQLRLADFIRYIEPIHAQLDDAALQMGTFTVDGEVIK